MGIYNFSSFILKLAKSKGKRATIDNINVTNANNQITGLYLDFNAILHNVSQQVYRYGEHKIIDTHELEQFYLKSDEQLNNEFKEALSQELLNLLKFYRPKKTFVIAVDGVAPPAKIKQQKNRRYKSAHESLTKSEVSRFNNVVITPGTTFMIEIDKFISQWIEKHRNILPEFVIYSGHLVHGEGEHKIFRYFKENNIELSGTHIIYGMDADLIMLSLLQDLNIILVRKNRNQISNLSIPILKEIILHEMNTTSIVDFILISFMIGNDFLPRQEWITDVGDAMLYLMNIYKTFRLDNPLIGSLIDNNGIINWKALYLFLSLLSKEEPQLMISRFNTDTSKVPLQPLIHAYNFENNTFNFQTFRYHWYNKICGPYNIDYTQNNVYFTEIDITNITSYYIYGLQWNLSYYLGHIDYKYYTQNVPHTINPTPVAPSYYYPYEYAPLLQDITSYLNIMVRSSMKLPLNLEIKPYYIGPHHQLVAVVPPQYSNILPSNFQSLIVANGELSDLSPINFPIDLEGKIAEYQGVPRLPPFELDRIIKMVDSRLRLSKFNIPQIPTKFRDGVEYINHHKSISSYHGLGKGTGFDFATKKRSTVKSQLRSDIVA